MTKNKKSNFHKHLTLAIILLIITATIVGAILTITVGFTSSEEVTHTNAFYELRGNPTNYQDTLFKKLTAEVEKSTPDELSMASLIVQNFVADYFTWDNKLGTYDVGGKTFVFANEFTNFNATSRRYLYAPMINYIASGLEMKDLPEVKEVTITAVNYAYPFDYYGTSYTSYYVEASWTYVANEKVDTSIFQNWGAFTIIKTDEGRYEIARFY